MHSITRSTSLALGLVAGSLSIAAAENTYNETVVHETTTTVEVDLNSSSVLCSAADYGATFLKVLIPDLAKLTLLDHQNTGAGQPCVAAGPCGPGQMPADIIDAAHPKETVQITVKAVRGDDADSVAQTCNTGLTETVKVTIRGVDFFHQRFADLGQRPYSDCVTSTAAPDPDPGSGSGSGSADTGSGSGSGDGKTDTEEPSVEDPSGGCNAGGSGAGGTFAFLLGAMALIRRRRAA